MSLAIICAANISTGLVLVSRVGRVSPEAAVVASTSDWSNETVLTTDVMESSLTSQLLGLLPVLACVLICFGYAAGLGPVPWILFAELFPLPVRGPASSVTAVLRAITLFLSIKMFPAMLNTFDIGRGEYLAMR